MKELYRVHGIHLAADSVYGVYQIDPIDHPERSVMSPSDFYEALPHVEDGEVIYTSLDGNYEECFDLIEAEYGIDYEVFSRW